MHDWAQAARVYARARRALMFAEARAALHAVLLAARDAAADAAVAAEIIRRVEEAVRVVWPLIRNRVALRAMRQSATVTALAGAFRARLARAEVALLTAPYRTRVAHSESDSRSGAAQQ